MTAVDVLVTDQVDITEMSTKARGIDVFDVPDDKMFAFLDRNAVLGLTPETLFSHVDKVVYAELFELTKGRVLEHEKFVEQLAKWLKGKERDWVSSDVEAAAWRLVGFTYFAEMWSIAAPVVDDKMIVIKEPYTSLIMDGMKTMELRCHAINGEYFISWQTRLRIQSRQNWSSAGHGSCRRKTMRTPDFCIGTRIPRSVIRKQWVHTSPLCGHLLRSRHIRTSSFRVGMSGSSPLLCDRSSVEVGGVPAPTPPDRGAAFMPACVCLRCTGVSAVRLGSACHQ